MGWVFRNGSDNVRIDRAVVIVREIVFNKLFCLVGEWHFFATEDAHLRTLEKGGFFFFLNPRGEKKKQITPYKIPPEYDHFFFPKALSLAKMRKKVVWIQKNAEHSLEQFGHYLHQCRDICLNVCWEVDKATSTLRIVNIKRESIEIVFREPTDEESKTTLTIKTEKSRMLGSFDTGAREFVRGYLVVHHYFEGECNNYSGVLEREEHTESLEKRIHALERICKKRKLPTD